MAYQQHSTTALQQPLFQPLYRLNIEVVGRLIEQQQIGLEQQDLRQFNSHSPASGKLRTGPVEIRAHESQTDKHFLHLPNRFRVVLIAHRIYLLPKGRPFVVNHVLRQIPDAKVFIFGNTSACRLFFPGNKPQKGSLTGTIFADKRHSITFVDQESYVVEYRPSRKLHTDIFYRYHYCDLLLDFFVAIVPFSSPALRKRPVYPASHFMSASGVPSNTIRPPCSPPSGPRSIT